MAKFTIEKVQTYRPRRRRPILLIAPSSAFCRGFSNHMPLSIELARDGG